MEFKPVKRQLHSIILTSTLGIEELCRKEAIEHGAIETTVRPGKVEIKAELETAYRLALHSRFGSRVLLEIARFSADNKETFYNQAVEIEWEKEIPEDSTIAIDCRIYSTRNTELIHSVYAAQLLKDAVCDRMRKITGKRPQVDTKHPNIRLALNIRQKSCMISLDFSGEALHKRGYRKQMTTAPLKENLAAAILERAGWKEMAKEGRPLLDPMCGSGTFVIEAAMMAGDIPPGINRKFYGFLRWQKHQPGLWKAIKDQAERNLSRGLSNIPKITAVEIDPRAYEAALENIKAAGLEKRITLLNKDIFDLKIEDCFTYRESDGLPTGLIAVNPPYGERLSDKRQAEFLCRRIGNELPQNFPGWKMAMLAGSKELSIATGLRPYKTNPLKNGPIDAVLAIYNFLENAADPIKEIRETEGQQMLLNRLKKNAKQHKKWLTQNGISCYRIYDADMPEYSAAIDCYDTVEEGIHIVTSEYAPPPSIPQHTRSRRLNLIIDTIPQFFEIPTNRIHLKVRKKQKGKDQYTKSRDEFNFFTVIEDGLKFHVDFDRYLDTGLFLDHRPVRKLIRNILMEKKSSNPNKTPLFINLFAYTCTASIYAAAAGADTVSVDLSSTYLDWGRKNFTLNRFSTKQHRFFRDDSITFMSKENRKFDLIYIDPPTFSNSKRTAKDFNIEEDYVDLIKQAATILAPEGEILFSNNFRRFKMDYNALSDFELTNISDKTIDPDFLRNRKIHNAWRIKKKADLS